MRRRQFEGLRIQYNTPERQARLARRWRYFVTALCLALVVIAFFSMWSR